MEGNRIGGAVPAKQGKLRRSCAEVAPGTATPNGVSAVQAAHGKGSGDADMFHCTRKMMLLPLWARENGMVSASLGMGAVLPMANGGHADGIRLAGAAAMASVAVLAVLVAARVLRQILVRKELARRVTYDLLPSASFDPSAEDVARFAHQLARTRPAVAWLRSRRGAAVRIRLYTDAEGRLSYQVSGPSPAGSVLRHQSYAQVELRAATVGEGTDDPGGHAASRDDQGRAR